MILRVWKMMMIMQMLRRSRVLDICLLAVCSSSCAVHRSSLLWLRHQLFLKVKLPAFLISLFLVFIVFFLKKKKKKKSESNVVGVFPCPDCFRNAGNSRSCLALSNRSCPGNQCGIFESHRRNHYKDNTHVRYIFCFWCLEGKKKKMIFFFSPFFSHLLFKKRNSLGKFQTIRFLSAFLLVVHCQRHWSDLCQNRSNLGMDWDCGDYFWRLH